MVSAQPRSLRWEESEVRAGDVHLHVRRASVDPPPERTSPILLLHGLGVSGQVWQVFARRLLPRLAIAPDLRGHGQSDAPPIGYQPPDYARDLAHLLENEGPSATPMPVMGHSLGALVAVALGAVRPDLVSALILVDPPLDPDRQNSDVPEVYRLRREPDRALEQYLLRTNPGGGPLVANMLAGLFRQAVDAAYEALLDAPPGHPATWEAAKRLTQPVLVVQADPTRGGILGDQSAARFTRSLANGRLVKVAGATHAVHASQPAALAESTHQFLDA